MTDIGPWKMRVLGLEFHRADEVLDHPFQWHEHPPEQQLALRGILDEIGIADVMIAYHSERCGGKLVRIDGHGRKDLNPAMVWPFLILDLADHEADLMLATLDPITGMARTNRDKLQELLEEVHTGTAALQGLLSGLAVSAAIIPPDIPLATPPEDFPEYDEDVETEYRCPHCGYEWSGKPK